MAHAWLQLGYARPAEEQFERLIARSRPADAKRGGPPESRAATARAISRLLWDLGDLDKAERWAVRALNWDRTDPVSSIGLGMILAERGHLEQGIEHCSEALRIDPGNTSALYHQGVLLSRAGEFQAAIECYRAIPNDDYYAAASRNNLGTIYDRQGELRQAETEYRGAGGLAAAHFNLGWLYHRQRLYRAAKQQYRRAIELGFDRAIVYRSLGACMLKLYEKPDEVIDVMLEGHRRDPKNAMSNKNLATAYWWKACDNGYAESDRLDARRQTKRYAQRVAELMPQWDEAHDRLGETMWALGSTGEAEAEFRKSMRRGGPTNPAYDHLAALLTDRPVPQDADRLAAEIRTLERAQQSRVDDSPTAALLEKYRRALAPRVASFASADWWLERPDSTRLDDSEWRAFHATHSPAPGWWSVEFDESQWTLRTFPVGEDSPDGRSFVSPAAQGTKRPADACGNVYLRRKFQLEETAPVRQLWLRVRIRGNDGVVVYLNGREAGRHGMGKSGVAPTFDAKPPSPREGRTSTRELRFEIPPHWVSSSNTLAMFLAPAATDAGDPTVAVELGVSPTALERVVARGRKLVEGLVPLDDPATVPVTQYVVARLDLLEGRPNDALARFEELLEFGGSDSDLPVAIGPNSPELQLQYAQCLRLLERPFDAEKVLRESLVSREAAFPPLLEEWRQLVLLDLGWSSGDIVEKFPVPLDARSEDEVDAVWAFERFAADQPLRINCGAGIDYVADDENDWSSERYLRFSGVPFFLGELDDVQLSDRALFQTSRVFWDEGPLVPGYSIPVPDGTYRVTLSFIEGFQESAPKRRFDVFLEGMVTRLEDYSPASAVGFGRVDSHSLDVDVRDGRLNIDFGRRRDDPEICAFEIHRISN